MEEITKIFISVLKRQIIKVWTDRSKSENLEINIPIRIKKKKPSIQISQIDNTI